MQTQRNRIIILLRVVEFFLNLVDALFGGSDNGISFEGLLWKNSIRDIDHSVRAIRDRG